MELTVTELANEFNLTVEHCLMLIKRGHLPKGRKEGKKRYLPATEARLILFQHTPGEHWAPSGTVKPRAPRKKAAEIDWAALI